MTSSFRSAWLKLINVKEEESTTVGFFFLHHFFLGLGLALFFTVAGTFFLSLFSVEYFPIVFMLSAVAMMFVGRIYSYFEHDLNIKELLPWVVLFLIALTILFRIAFGIAQIIMLPILLMIGFRIVYLLINLEFWGLSALVFDVRQGKRLFGLISSGDVPAKLLGYASVYTLVPYINLENLLIVGAISFLVSYYFLKQILKRSEISVEHEHAHGKSFTNKSIIQSYFGNDFILSIGILGFLIVATFTLIEYVFLSSVQSQYTTEKELATFLSIFFSVGYFFTLVFKSIFSGRFSDKVGLKKSLLVLPFILLIFSFVFIFYGTNDSSRMSNLIFIGIMTMTMGVVKYSINDPVFLVLFQPLQPYLRLKGHSVIKGFIQPIALGVIGLLLWIIDHTKGVTNFYYLNFGLFTILILWIISVLVTNKKYLSTLSYAIRKRFISGANVAVRDKMYYDLLLEKIKSVHVQEVAYAISVLSFSNPKLLKNKIQDSLKRKEPLIQEYCISAILSHKWEEFGDGLEFLYENSVNQKIKARAINAYCQLRDDAFSKLSERLISKDILIRKAIITGLINGGNIMSQKEGERILMELLHSESNSDKILGCSVLNELVKPSTNISIIHLLNDSSDSVVKSAIVSSGNLKNDELLPKLFEFLHNNKFRNEILFTLSSYDNISTVLYNQYNQNININEQTLYRYTKILDRVKDEDAAKLLAIFLSHPMCEIREQAIYSLSSFPNEYTKKYVSIFDKLLNDELEFACKITGSIDNSSLHDSIKSALHIEMSSCVRRIFSLMSLVYDKELVKKAESAIAIAKKEAKANALEILDHIIPRRVHQCLVALLDDIPGSEKFLKLNKYHKPDKSKMTDYIISKGRNNFNNWTISSTLNHGEFSDSSIKFIVELLNDTARIVKESATKYLRKIIDRNDQSDHSIITTFNPELDMESKKAHKGRLSELEKIIVLKSTALFSETPENVIAEIAEIVKEVVIGKDEMIFDKGDPGNSMYIIYDGEIRIHEGDKTFALLQKLNFFGELALLDPEPRSAAATATTDTLLLRIDQEAAYELMDDRTEVLKSMMTILCRRIRAQNVKITEIIDSHKA